MTADRPAHVDRFDPPSTPSYRWYRDMFGRYVVHLANRHRYLHEAAGRRWVFSIDEIAVDVDQPEIPGDGYERCPDCLDVAHRYEPPTDEQARQRDAVRQTIAELDDALRENGQEIPVDD